MKRRLKKRSALAALLVLVMVLLGAFAANTASAASVATVSGVIRDSAGSPLPNVKVIVWTKAANGAWSQWGATVATGADGAYSGTINFGPAPGPWMCTVFAEDQNHTLGEQKRSTWYGDVGYLPDGVVTDETQANTMATSFSLAIGDAKTGIDIKMKRRDAKMTGVITNASGAPLSGVTVRGYGRSNGTLITGNASPSVTGVDGKYTLWLPPVYDETAFWTVWAGDKSGYDDRFYDYPENQDLTHEVACTDPHNQDFRMGSEEDSTVAIVMTENRPDTISITSAKQQTKPKLARTIIAAGSIRPIHIPELQVKVDILKLNAAKKYVRFASATPVLKHTAKSLSLSWTIRKAVPKGTYKVKVSIPAHYKWADSHHRARSATSKAFVIK
jgi:hypothetical protein